MANILTIASYSIQDVAGVKAPYASFWTLPDTLTLAQVATFFAGTLGPAVDAMTDGQIIRVSVELRPTFNPPGTYKSAPAAGSNVEKTGLFNFQQTGSAYKSPLDIPAIASAVLKADQTIDLTNTNVLDFIALNDAASVGGETPTSKYANALIALIDAVTTFRKHRRQLNRSTFEPGS